MGKKTVKRKKAMVVRTGSSMPANSPADVIRMAVAGKASLDKMEKFLELQERFDANQARKVFTSSFALTQAKIGAVLKTKLNPQTKSKYADLGDIIKSAQPIYTGEGFSIIFYEGETTVPENIRVCADVLHRAGHKETYHYDVPLDGTGLKGNPNMTKIHGKSSSVSYGRRYLMCMIWNIPTYDDNGQAAGGPVEYISATEVKQIKDLGFKYKIDNQLFLSHMGIESIEKMLKNDLKKAIAALKARKEEVEK